MLPQPSQPSKRKMEECEATFCFELHLPCLNDAFPEPRFAASVVGTPMCVLKGDAVATPARDTTAKA